MSMQINKSAYEKLIKEDIEWLLSNTKDSLERRHIVEVLNYSPERLYANSSSEIPNDLEEAAKAYADDTNPTDSFYEAFKEGAKWQKEQMMDEWLKDRDGCFWDGVEEGKKAMREQMLKEAVTKEGKFQRPSRDASGLGYLEISTLNTPFEEGDEVIIQIRKKES